MSVGATFHVQPIGKPPHALHRVGPQSRRQLHHSRSPFGPLPQILLSPSASFQFRRDDAFGLLLSRFRPFRAVMLRAIRSLICIILEDGLATVPTDYDGGKSRPDTPLSACASCQERDRSTAVANNTNRPLYDLLALYEKHVLTTKSTKDTKVPAGPNKNSTSTFSLPALEFILRALRIFVVDIPACQPVDSASTGCRSERDIVAHGVSPASSGTVLGAFILAAGRPALRSEPTTSGCTNQRFTAQKKLVSFAQRIRMEA
jgi:hypothetical protein